MIRLKVVKGTVRGEVPASHEHVITLGRATENTLSFAEPHVSRQHARISFSVENGGRYTFRDLGSVGGSIIRRGKMEYVVTGDTEEMPLQVDDEIVLAEGDAVVKVEEISLQDLPFEPPTEKAVRRVPLEELPEICARVYTNRLHLRNIVEFDGKVASATSVHEALDATVRYLVQLYPKSLYAAAPAESLEPDAPVIHAAGESAPAGWPLRIRMSRTIRALAESACGVRYMVSKGLLLTPNGPDQILLSPRSTTLDQDVVGVAAPVLVEEEPRYILLLECDPDRQPLGDEDLDLLVVIATRVGARIENILSMDRLARQRQFAMTGALTACVTHDLKNVVSKLTGSVGLIQDEAWEQRPRQKKDEVLSVLTHGVKLVMARCSDFMDLQRTGTKIPTDLRPLADSVIEDCRPLLAPTVGLSLQCGQNLPRLECEPEKVKRVLWNLLDNVYKVAHDRKLASVRVSVIIESVRGGVRFGVHDDIPGGMPQDDQQDFLSHRDKIFSAGTDDMEILKVLCDRMEAAGQKQKQGFGIGSFFFCMAVRDMGGKIEVETGPGGSTFSFTLPKGRSG